MRKTTVALVSFLAGILCSLGLGNQPSTALNASEFSQFALPDKVPVVPPIGMMKVQNSTKSGGTVFLDGMNMENNILKNPTFEYGGGAFRLAGNHIEGTVKISLKGAAINTAVFLNSFGLIGCPATPSAPRVNPNTPLLAVLKTPLTKDLISPDGQK
jgi:hypothetical protein